MDSRLERARRKLTDKVMHRPGVTGTAIGEHDGEPCLVVYLESKEDGARIPGAVDGFPVIKETTGKIRSL